jgi:hypothetical protein
MIETGITNTLQYHGKQNRQADRQAGRETGSRNGIRMNVLP